MEASNAGSAAVGINGSRLRQIRKEAGVEIPELAAAAGVTRQHLSRVELGRRSRVRPQTFRLICEYLDIPRSERWQLMSDEGVSTTAAAVA